jgi:hypothetical protein
MRKSALRKGRKGRKGRNGNERQFAASAFLADR